MYFSLCEDENVVFPCSQCVGRFTQRLERVCWGGMTLLLKEE